MINSENLSEEPRINEVFDTISQKKDGTITPCSPIVVKGENLICDKDKKQTFFFLLSDRGEGEILTPIEQIYHFKEGKIVMFLPNLPPGNYQPVLIIKEGKTEIKKYFLPTTWIVKER